MSSARVEESIFAPAAPAHDYDTVVLLSGGLDSAVLLSGLLADRGQRPLGLHFQLMSSSWELRAARRIARRLNVPLRVIDLRPFMRACETRREPHHLVFGTTVMFAMALTFANEHGIRTVAAGLNQGDAENEAEHRPAVFSWLASGAHSLGMRTAISLPFHGWSKEQIVREGTRLGAPLAYSWSCVTPIDGLHDGRCHACIERQAAFRLAGVPDPTRYAPASGQFGVTDGQSISAAPAAAPVARQVDRT